MAEIFDLRKQAKEWLKETFIPKEISSEGFNNTGLGKVTFPMAMASVPGVPIILTALSKLLETKPGKQVQTMLDATGPMGGGLDDLVVAGAKSAPAAIAAVAPMFMNLGRMKPRGVPARPSEYFHSNLAEAVDKQFIAPGEAGDLLNIKQIRSWLSKLPGLGVKKEEIAHFDIAGQLDKFSGKSENYTPTISKGVLADMVDNAMPAIDTKPHYSDELTNRYSEYVLPGGNNYQNHLLHSPDREVEVSSPNKNGGIEKWMATDYSPFTDNTDHGHWDTPNVLQHIRTTDRVLPTGEKTLYAEEVQSDWQQSGNPYPLPSNFEDLAHKYLYRQAADEGYDSVAWAPGSVHINRWHGEKRGPKKLIINGISDLPLSHPLRQEYESKSQEVSQLYGRHSDEDYNLTLEYTDKAKALGEKFMDSGVDNRFSGFETFYNKRMVDSAKGMLKRMGGGQVSETPLNNHIKNFEIPNGPEDHYNVKINKEPIQHILDDFKIDNPPDMGWVQPAPHKSFKYDIRPEDKFIGSSMPKDQDYNSTEEWQNAVNKHDWSKPLAGKTVPLWMTLGALGIRELHNNKKDKKD